jgi:hypothetical protein
MEIGRKEWYKGLSISKRAYAKSIALSCAVCAVLIRTERQGILCAQNAIVQRTIEAGIL